MATMDSQGHAPCSSGSLQGSLWLLANTFPGAPCATSTPRSIVENPFHADWFGSRTLSQQGKKNGEQSEDGAQGAALWDASGTRPAGSVAAEPPPSTSSASSSGSPRSPAMASSAVQLKRVRREAAAGRPVGWCTFADCGAPCSSWEEQVEHWKTRHPPETEGIFLCQWCLKTRPRGLARSRHLEAHRRRELPCPWCSARFVAGMPYHLHQEKFHRVVDLEVTGWCTEDGCPRSLGSWEEFYEHYTLDHVPGKPLWQTCRLCLAPSADAVSATRHAEEHESSEAFGCKRCSASFLSNARMAKHVSEFHWM